jgi:hypothetical protein
MKSIRSRGRGLASALACASLFLTGRGFADVKAGDTL